MEISHGDLAPYHNDNDTGIQAVDAVQDPAAGSLSRSRIVPPQVPAEYSLRPAIRNLLDRNPHSRVLMFSAPAGFGKTCALAALARERTVADQAVAWLSLAEEDDDPARFCRQLIEALGEAVPQLGDDAQTYLQNTMRVPVVAVIESLLGDLDRYARPLLLVLDDLHLVSNPDIFTGLNRLVQYAPPGLVLALGTRSQPALSLAYLAGQGTVAGNRPRGAAPRLRGNPRIPRAQRSLSGRALPEGALWPDRRLGGGASRQPVAAPATAGAGNGPARRRQAGGQRLSAGGGLRTLAWRPAGSAAGPWRCQPIERRPGQRPDRAPGRPGAAGAPGVHAIVPPAAGSRTPVVSLPPAVRRLPPQPPARLRSGPFQATAFQRQPVVHQPPHADVRHRACLCGGRPGDDRRAGRRMRTGADQPRPAQPDLPLAQACAGRNRRALSDPGPYRCLVAGQRPQPGRGQPDHRRTAGALGRAAAMGRWATSTSPRWR